MDEQEVIKIMGEAYGEYVRAYDSLEDIDGLKPPRDKYPDVLSYMTSKIWPTIEAQMERIKELEKRIEVIRHNRNEIFNQNIRNYKRITELEAALEQHRWILVSERLPELPSGPPNASSESVCLIFKNKPQMGYYTNYDGWRIYGIRFQKRINQKDITHWKPIIIPESKP